MGRRSVSLGTVFQLGAVVSGGVAGYFLAKKDKKKGAIALIFCVTMLTLGILYM